LLTRVPECGSENRGILKEILRKVRAPKDAAKANGLPRRIRKNRNSRNSATERMSRALSFISGTGEINSRKFTKVFFESDGVKTGKLCRVQDQIGEKVTVRGVWTLG